MKKKSNQSDTRFKSGNRYAWKKGQSGNPKGRPKAKTLSEAYRRLLWEDDGNGSSLAEAIAQNIFRIAQSTSGTSALSAAREIADRTEGKLLATPPAEQIDPDLLKAASSITAKRLVARALGCSYRQLPESPLDEDESVRTLEGEVDLIEDGLEMAEEELKLLHEGFAELSGQKKSDD